MKTWALRILGIAFAIVLCSAVIGAMLDVSARSIVRITTAEIERQKAEDKKYPKTIHYEGHLYTEMLASDRSHFIIHAAHCPVKHQ